MTDTNQLPPPPLQPGDSHMESLIEAAIQGHASTREAMRWLVRQIVPQPAQATQAELTDELLHPEDFNVEVVMKPVGGFDPVRTHGVRVTHKPTGISVTCDAARSQHTNRHHAFEQLRAILALRPAAVPMTPDDISDACDEVKARSILSFMRGVRAAEAHHGITAQAKKETP